MAEWITVKEAAKKLSESERNVRLKIQTGKLKAKRDGRRWLIHSSLSMPDAEELAAEQKPVGSQSEDTAAAESELVEVLRERIEKQDQQIERLEDRLKEESDRRDALILQITRITEQNQLLLIEDKRRPSWWQRWRRKSEAKDS
jgi:excisionase family DNA binding protein